MVANQRQQSQPDQPDEREEEDVVDAGQPTTEPQQKVLHEDAARRIHFAEAEARFAGAEHHTAERLRRMGDTKRANELDDDSMSHFDDAAQEFHIAEQELDEEYELRVQDRVDSLALVVKDSSRQELVPIGQAVEAVAAYVVQHMTERDFAEAAGGDPYEGQQLRRQVLGLSESIRHGLAHTIHSAETARRVVEEIVNFVAAILTIADHVPHLRDVVHQFGALVPFIVR